MSFPMQEMVKHCLLLIIMHLTHGDTHHKLKQTAVKSTHTVKSVIAEELTEESQLLDDTGICKEKK